MHSDSSIPAPLPSVSQATSIVRACLGNDVTLAGCESHVVEICLAGMNIDCEAICLNDSVKVNHLPMEDAICTVSPHGNTYVVYSTSPHLRNLRMGTYMVDFEILPTRVGVVRAARVCSSAETLRSEEHRLRVKKAPIAGIDFPEAKDKLRGLLDKYHHIISLPGDPAGSTDVLKHNIPINPNVPPIYVPSYRTPHAQRAILDQAIKDMLSENIIEPTTSPWNFPIFLVRKKDGSMRPVVVYRKLNAACQPQKYPLPLLQDILSSVGQNNRVFSTLDLASGYWQVELTNSSKPLTAFSTPSGNWQFRKIPFGISGAPLTFQRLINHVHQGLIGKSVFTFLDDVIIVSENIDSHLRRLIEVFDRFSEAGLTLRYKKCDFLRQSITYLGHILDKDGARTTPDKVKAIQNFPTPHDKKSVRSFLGLSGFYRSFIKKLFYDRPSYDHPT